MPAPSPATDPLWAYNTLGWTNQGNTGDIPTGGTTSFDYIQEPASLSYFLARTLDPDLSVAAGYTIGSSNTFYGGLVWFPGPTLVTSLVFDITTVGGTPTISYATIWNPTQNNAVLAVSANSTSALASGMNTVNFTAKTVIPSGVYYVGMSLSQPTHTTVISGIASLQPECQSNLTGTAPYFYRFITITGQTLTTSPPTIGANMLTFIATGTVNKINSGLFFGLI